MKHFFLIFTFSLFSVFQSVKAQTSNISMSGNVSFNFDSDNVILKVDRIRNNEREGGNSGTLKWSVYFSKEFYSGKGQITGVKVFEQKMKSLDGGYARTDMKYDGIWLNKPQDGEYYVTICLLEYDGRDQRYYIVNSHAFDKKSIIDFNAREEIGSFFGY